MSSGNSSSGTGPGGVPSPNGEPPSSSRPCGVSQTEVSGPAGMICVGLMSLWTSAPPMTGKHMRVEHMKSVRSMTCVRSEPEVRADIVLHRREIYAPDAKIYEVRGKRLVKRVSLGARTVKHQRFVTVSSTVPEPGTFALGATGLVALGLAISVAVALPVHAGLLLAGAVWKRKKLGLERVIVRDRRMPVRVRMWR